MPTHFISSALPFALYVAKRNVSGASSSRTLFQAVAMSGGTSSVFLPPPPPAKCVTFGPAPGAFSPKPPPAPLPLDMVLATRPSFFDLPSASAWDLSALSIISDMARWTTEADTTRLGALPTRACGG